MIGLGWAGHVTESRDVYTDSPCWYVKIVLLSAASKHGKYGPLGQAAFCVQLSLPVGTPVITFVCLKSSFLSSLVD